MFAQNIDCGYTLKPPRMFWIKNKKQCIPQFNYIISRLKGISWGTKKRFWLTLAPENNTAELYMVEKVIILGI